jgi:hypothetical protein
VADDQADFGPPPGHQRCTLPNKQLQQTSHRVLRPAVVGFWRRRLLRRRSAPRWRRRLAAEPPVRWAASETERVAGLHP